MQTSSTEDAIEWLRSKRPNRQNHWPALTLAFIAQIEELLDLEGLDSVPDVLAAYPPAQDDEGAVVNTLNLTRPSGHLVRLRPYYNMAMDLIRNEMLRDHPSNAAHATQSWRSYTELIRMIAALSPAERRQFAEQVWTEGVLERAARELASVKQRLIRPFELVLAEMPTAVKGIRGGALLQAIAFGYLRADSPNLILESHSVNTGSSHAGMLGDVDGFRGQEPELAAEVKDVHITAANWETQLNDFLEDIVRAPNVTAVVVCSAIDSEPQFELEARGVSVLSRGEMLHRVAVWDLPKQEEALRGAEYYLGRIQRQDRAVQYVRDWLISHGVDAGLGDLPRPN